MATAGCLHPGNKGMQYRLESKTQYCRLSQLTGMPQINFPLGLPRAISLPGMQFLDALSVNLQPDETNRDML